MTITIKYIKSISKSNFRHFLIFLVFRIFYFIVFISSRICYTVINLLIFLFLDLNYVFKHTLFSSRPFQSPITHIVKNTTSPKHQDVYCHLLNINEYQFSHKMAYPLSNTLLDFMPIKLLFETFLKYYSNRQ